MLVDFWDKRYAVEEFAYGIGPNLFFKEQIEGMVPGKLLLPGEGEGRNAVYAASLGWEVYAFDQSEAGRTKAMQLASDYNVEINYSVSTIEAYTVEVNDFDLIALIYIHIRPHVRAKFHNKLVQSLKQGGDIILEAFNKKQIMNQSGGPKNEDLLYSGNMLAYDFQGLDSITFSNTNINLDEGPFHQGHADLIRMIGKAKLIR